MAGGFPADYVDWSDSEDELVFSDEEIVHECPPVAHRPPSPNITVCPPSLQQPPVPAQQVEEPPTQEEQASSPEWVSPVLQADFQVAVTKGNVELARKLLARGVKASSKGEWSALVKACFSANVEMVQLLLDHGADVNCPQRLLTPLMAACASNVDDEPAVLKCVEILLDHGAEPNYENGEGTTALMHSARQGYCKVIDLLLERGANIKSVDIQGWSALYWAAYGGQGRAARFLLKKLPDELLSLVALDGQMPSDVAHSRGFRTLARILTRFEEEYEKRGREAALDIDNPSTWSVAVFNRKCKEAFGDVALVLAAIEQLKLLPLFQKHNVGFQEMLTLDDNALQKMGVESEEDRRKVIVGIESTRRFQMGRRASGDCESVDCEMESFLSALELVKLSGTLREHGVKTLDALLRLDEKGLERAGVTEVGTQRRLAAAIRRAHQLPWHRTSLVELPRGPAITCTDAVAVVSVVGEHLGHLEASMAHLRQHVRQRPEDLRRERDLCSVRHLRDELRRATGALHALSDTVRDVDGIIAKLEDNPDYLPHWPPPEPRQQRRRWPVWVPLCLVLTTTLWLYRSPSRMLHWAPLRSFGL